jgi:hypothetical protein
MVLLPRRSITEERDFKLDLTKVQRSYTPPTPLVVVTIKAQSDGFIVEESANDFIQHYQVVGL